MTTCAYCFTFVNVIVKIWNVVVDGIRVSQNLPKIRKSASIRKNSYGMRTCVALLLFELNGTLTQASMLLFNASTVY